MIIRAIAIVAGLAGAAGLSQFPAYSQQYTQRLAGAVEELSAVVARFDADAAGLGLSRAQALEDLRQGSRMAKARALSMQQVLARHARLSADLSALREAGFLSRLAQIQRFSDLDLAREAWGDFRPALPLSRAGLSLAAAGFVAGYVLLTILCGMAASIRRNARGKTNRMSQREH